MLEYWRVLLILLVILQKPEGNEVWRRANIQGDLMWIKTDKIDNGHLIDSNLDFCNNQGKTLEMATQLLEEAVLLESLGCFSIVLEGVPSVVAEVLTEKVSIPTIGIGAGVNVDGQVLVFHGLIGMKSKEYIDAKFVKRYANQHEQVVKALENFKNEVENKKFPTEYHSYKAGKITENDLKEWKKEIKKILS